MAILAGFTSTLLLGGWLVIDGRLEVGLYTVLVFMTQRLLWPLTDLGETLDLYQRAMASTRRIFALLSERGEQPSPGPATLALPVRGRLELRGVRFGYADGPDVLRGLDLVVPAGETHAVVGTTGAGKSSLLRLVLRFSDPREGQVLLDGTDVRELGWDSLRGAIGYVSQDVFLFHGTVRDNLAYGRADATDEQVREAARLAEAHAFIAALPQGYDTVVGERGQTLSGGQRQRIALARAILRDPALLVLDEATSAVDNETEAAIQRSLAAVTASRTALVVAHRLSTVRDADRIWVLAGGRVAEAGTHDELVAAGGIYAGLWAVQTGEAVGRRGRRSVRVARAEPADRGRRRSAAPGCRATSGGRSSRRGERGVHDPRLPRGRDGRHRRRGRHQQAGALPALRLQARPLPRAARPGLRRPRRGGAGRARLDDGQRRPRRRGDGRLLRLRVVGERRVPVRLRVRPDRRRPRPGAALAGQQRRRRLHRRRDRRGHRLPPEHSKLLAISMVGLAQVGARYWVSDRSAAIGLEQAKALVSTLAWRGISGFPLRGPARPRAEPRAQPSRGSADRATCSRAHAQKGWTQPTSPDSHRLAAED